MTNTPGPDLSGFVAPVLAGGGKEPVSRNPYSNTLFRLGIPAVAAESRTNSLLRSGPADVGRMYLFRKSAICCAEYVAVIAAEA